MARQRQLPLEDRVTKAAEEALDVLGHARPIDVLLGIRWLDQNLARRWEQGQIDSLEDAMQTNPVRIAEAMQLFQAWAARKSLVPTEATYVTRTPQRQPLRFTRAGDPAVEAQFRTHWLSPALSARQREHLAEKASQPPEQVVIEPLNQDWKCHRCGGTGGMLVMETPSPACLRCVGLDDLEFLPRGDALLTRRARARSTRSAVVVRFSRARKRYERQGLLVEAPALAEAEASLAKG